jgi:hypothetical protein
MGPTFIAAIIVFASACAQQSRGHKFRRANAGTETPPHAGLDSFPDSVFNTWSRRTAGIGLGSQYREDRRWREVRWVNCRDA